MSVKNTNTCYDGIVTNKYAPDSERIYIPGKYHRAIERCNRCIRQHYSYKELAVIGNKVSSDKLASPEAHIPQPRDDNEKVFY